MGSSTMIHKLVSSAKSLIEELIYKRKKKRNWRGPRIEPCGTPALNEVQEEFAPDKITLCFLSLR